MLIPKQTTVREFSDETRKLWIEWVSMLNVTGYRVLFSFSVKISTNGDGAPNRLAPIPKYPNSATNGGGIYRARKDERNLSQIPEKRRRRYYGGGKALDVAKYIGFLSRYLSVPTSLSNDGFCSRSLVLCSVTGGIRPVSHHRASA